MKSWDFLFYFVVLPMQLCQNMTNLNIVGRRTGNDIDLNGLSSTSSELLPTDGTVLYSRQDLEDVNSQIASTRGQASQEITLGTGNVQIPPSQKTGHTNVPPSEHNSEHIQVKLVFGMSQSHISKGCLRITTHFGSFSVTIATFILRSILLCHFYRVG